METSASSTPNRQRRRKHDNRLASSEEWQKKSHYLET
jgi:hypothetical protein